MCFLKGGEYLVRQADGAAFSFGGATPNGRKPFPEYNGEEFSSNGNSIIYISENDELIKLDVSDLTNLSYKVISATGDEVYKFCADSYGNVIYSSYDGGSNNALRYRHSTGGFELLPGAFDNIDTRFWTNPNDSEIFFYNSMNDYIQRIQTSPYAILKYGSEAH